MKTHLCLVVSLLCSFFLQARAFSAIAVVAGDSTHAMVSGGTDAPPIHAVTVLPDGLSELIDGLSLSVDESSAPRPAKFALKARLRKTRRAFEKNRLSDGIFNLSEFQHLVRSRIPDHESSADFIGRAQHIINSAVKPVLLSNNTQFEGKSIDDWSAEWWKWQMRASSNSNPMLDTNGAFATLDQPDSSVFLLGGHLGLVPDTFYRTFIVPETKYMFGAVLPYVADNVDGVDRSVEELREQARLFIDAATNLQASLNGVEALDLFSRRAISPVFNIVYTNADNLHSWAYGRPVIGLVDPMVSDGYWLLLEPLPPGMHVLNINSLLSEGSYGVHLADTINVTPVPIAGWLEEFAASIEASGLSLRARQRFVRTLSLASEAFAENDTRSGIAHLRKLDHQIRAGLKRNHPAFEGLTRRVARTMARATRDDAAE